VKNLLYTFSFSFPEIGSCPAVSGKAFWPSARHLRRLSGLYQLASSAKEHGKLSEFIYFL